MHTEENFEFSQELASVKSRTLAVFLDIFILMVIFLPFHAFRSVASEDLDSSSTHLSLPLGSKKHSLGVKISGFR